MDKNIIQKEIKFKALKSSGAGGQHVNKVATKIELYFDIKLSEGLNVNEKELILSKLENRISKNGVLYLSCQESRSQHKNKETVTLHFFDLLISSLKRTKKRKPTKPTRNSKIKKAKNKQNQSLKKQLRKKPKLD
ncbi:alternative ribosome rescue aminoacyl-tRNA hydrolase ArfB [Tenacibaculum sp. ZS6-P6]|uniref:alternative ribosome rescue aminoacyl-tRNA hydrolase ArfB n=1 Tax=Tenacibaculum sp. ZS6-P6 TaxID=3447503 RepID=UPI003F96C2B1